MSTSLKSLLATVCLLMGIITASLAQATSEQIEIPLSKPGQPGTLRANLMHGSIKVTGYTGKEVVVNYSSRNPIRKRDVPEEAQGLRRLSGNAGLEIREENNVVVVRNASFPHTVDLDIKVPTNFSVKLKTLSNGDIIVEDLNGELEIDNLNGNIALKNVSGSASASTLNGNITASFRKVTPNMPMAFSSLNGKIDVALPAAAQFNAKLKTDNGDIFTDFELATDKAAVKKMEITGEGNRLYVDKWMSGKINGGGPEILFKNFNGNIYIRKNK